jgi:glycerophosphoryl diester phosphodiesterase
MAALLVLSLATACGDDDDTDVSNSTTAAHTDGSTTTEKPEASTTTTETASQGSPSIDELLAPAVPLNIAHAGGDQASPHSTMFAFTEAVAAGADMLEFDVQLSGDGELIVQHDDTVDKTTDETGPVSDRTLAELQALDNAYWFSPQCWPCHDREDAEYIYRGVRTGDTEPPDGYVQDDFRIITFRELAEAFPDMPLDIEMKGDFPDAIPVAEKLAEEIAELDRTDSVIVVSFDSELVAAFSDLAPEVATSPGLDEMVAWFLAGAELGDYPVVQVPPDFEGVEVVTEAFMDVAEQTGVDVWVWPSDAGAQENEAFYREMVDLGAAGILAGRPAEMANAVS